MRLTAAVSREKGAPVIMFGPTCTTRSFISRQPRLSGATDPHLAKREHYGNRLRAFRTRLSAGFGILIAAGVVYNSARVAFQERAWELASLRILGYTALEVSAILLTELAVELLLALPVGLLLGRSFVQFLISAKASESFDIPAIIEPSSYAVSALVIVGATFATALLVRRKIDHLDLVAVLKTRDYG